MASYSRNSTTVSLVDPPQGPVSLSLDQTFLPYHSLPELSKTMIIRLVPATDSIHVALRNCGYCPLLEVVALTASHVAHRASLFANSVCIQSSTDALDQVLLRHSRRFPPFYCVFEQHGSVGGEQHITSYFRCRDQRKCHFNQLQLPSLCSHERSRLLWTRRLFSPVIDIKKHYGNNVFMTMEQVLAMSGSKEPLKLSYE